MKRNKVTICSMLFVFALLCLLFIPAIVKGQAIKSTPTEILQSPDKYDGKMVQVEGKVIAPNFKTSKKGNAYTTFKVTDPQDNTLSVFSFGTLQIEQGETVKVMGRFQKVKQVPPRYTFYNEIDASGGSVEKIK
jgi:cytochrome c-type biogenesis protein CcmE